MLTIRTADPDDADARAVVRRYLTEIVGRWHGRPAAESEVDDTARDEPADDLRGATGTLLLAELDGSVVGCAGIRVVGSEAELTKVFAAPEARGRGVGTMLVRAAEREAAARGAGAVRLETRSDLHEACALYERLGYAAVEPFSDGAYSDRWYRRAL